MTKILSITKSESLRESIEILSDPHLVKSIAQAEKDIAKGKVYDWEKIKKELKLDD